MEKLNYLFCAQSIPSFGLFEQQSDLGETRDAADASCWDNAGWDEELGSLDWDSMIFS